MAEIDYLLLVKDLDIFDCSGREEALLKLNYTGNTEFLACLDEVKEELLYYHRC